jgi:hypothetical protein
LTGEDPAPTTRGTGRRLEPAPTRATSGEPSHPDASLTPRGVKTPTTIRMIMTVKDPG